MPGTEGSSAFRSSRLVRRTLASLTFTPGDGRGKSKSAPAGGHLRRPLLLSLRWRSREDSWRCRRYIRHLEITSWCLTGRSSPRYLPVAVPGAHVPKSEKAPRTVPALLERFTSSTGYTCSFHRELFNEVLFSSSSFQFLASHARVRPRRQLRLQSRGRNTRITSQPTRHQRTAGQLGFGLRLPDS